MQNSDDLTKPKASIKVVNKYAYRLTKGKFEKCAQQDKVIVEQPLQIRLCWFEHNQTKSQIFSITMRTPDQDELLIIGLLFSEGVIGDYTDIDSIGIDHTVDESAAKTETQSFIQNLWEVKLNKGVIPKLASLERYQITYSSCGLCGSTSLKSLELKNPPNLQQTSHNTAWLAAQTLVELPQLMRSEQQMFTQAGGVHASALFASDDNGIQLLSVSEDIGRHNALDKVIGAYVKNTDNNGNNAKSTETTKIKIKDKVTEKHTHYIAVVSGRISFEIVQKSIMAGFSVLIGVGAPSDLAIKAAQRFDLTLIGFASLTAFNVYHGDWRLQ